MFTARSVRPRARAPEPVTAPIRNRRLPHVRVAVFAIGVLAAASVGAQRSESQETMLRRYPFDPACPFGRIANGKGMVVRCISEEESNFLLKRPAPGAPRTPEAPSTGVALATPPAAAAPSATAPSEVEPPDAPVTGDARLEVTVGPIVADQGELSVGKLSQPKSRYERCVLDHGGLKDKTGEVYVRFLVRSKGIAEGVSVQKRVNVSAEAARCVAEVVDRRRVGIPDAPLVGATLTVKFDRPAK